MFVVIKRKTIIAISIIIVVSVILSVALAVGISGKTTAAEGFDYIVVLDAGHGGVDAGVIGITSGVAEREINLLIALEVEKRLLDVGVGSVLTRKDENGLYPDLADGFKKRDFEERKRIIDASSADLIVSIHCNKFPDTKRRGAQCFFEPKSEASIALARALQTPLNVLNTREIGRTYDALKGDYFMLKCSSLPSAIVECGFMSNAEDDALLNNESYRSEIAAAIVEGILAFKASRV